VKERIVYVQAPAAPAECRISDTAFSLLNDAVDAANASANSRSAAN
jgi:hypothetical protein